jgi:hypothetical protein
MEEWVRLDARHVVARAIDRWSLADVPPGTSADGLLQLLGHDRSRSQERADAVLAELIGHAATDELAARVVLQRVLPGLVNIAKRRGGGWERDRNTAFNDVLASAWIVIREFPLGRRPQRIAANVLRDAEYFAFVRSRRLRSAAEQSTDIESMPLPVAGRDGRAVIHGATSFELVVELLAEARHRGFSDDDLRLAAGLASGHPVHQIAVDLGVSARTVLNRRGAVVARLRSLEPAA